MVALLIIERAQISNHKEDVETLKHVEYGLAFAGLITYNGCMAVLLREYYKSAAEEIFRTHSSHGITDFDKEK